MFILGHLGIGSKLVQPIAGKARAGLPKGWLLFGTIFPDILDKTVYYGTVWVTHGNSILLHWIRGTQGIGHTGIFVILLALIAYFWRSRILAALALGIASHIVLDEATIYASTGAFAAIWGRTPLLWPFFGWEFPVYPFHGIREHAESLTRPFIVITETIGGLFLAWDYWKSRHSREMIQQIWKHRFRLRKVIRDR